MAKTVEELEAELAALRTRIKGASAAADDDDPGATGRIPAARFAEHRRTLRELAEKVDGIQQQLGKTAAELKANFDKETKRLADEHKAAIEAESGRASVDLELSDRGVKDPTIRRLLREHHAALDEASRGESPTAWLEARRAAAEKAKADDKATAPDPLPWLDAYEAHVAATGKAQDQGRQRRPPPDTHTGAGPSNGDGYTAEDISRMSPAQLAKFAGLPDPSPRT